jgi:ankyrin repeat protein
MAAESFFEMLRSGNAAGVAAALESDPRLAAARDASGLSAVIVALYHRQTPLVPLLLSQNPPLDVFEAAALGRATDVATHLARDPECARSYSADGFTPLHLAAFFSRPEVAKVLIERGADVRAVARNPSRVEPIHSAVASGQAEVAVQLLRSGADPNARQQGGFTPLHAAAQRGNVALIGELTASGADPGLTSDDGRSAVDMAGERSDVVAAVVAGRSADGRD